MAGGKKGGKDKGTTRGRPVHGVKRADTYGAKTIKTLTRISQTKQDEEVKRSLELGLEAANSIVDRNISLFSRGHQPAFAGINTFMKAPYCEDIRKVGDFEAAFVGAPFDSATTYRPGTRFGPQAVRRISALYDGYWFDGGVDIFEELDLCDAGDIFVIPGNIEKTFDQVTKAVSHIFTSGMRAPSRPIATTATCMTLGFQIATPRIWCRLASAAGTATGRAPRSPSGAARACSPCRTSRSTEPRRPQRSRSIWRGKAARRSTCPSISTRSIQASRLGRDRRNPADSCRARLCR